MWACLCLRHALFQLLSKCLGMILLWLCPVSLPSVSLLNKTSYTLWEVVQLSVCLFTELFLFWWSSVLLRLGTRNSYIMICTCACDEATPGQHVSPDALEAQLAFKFCKMLYALFFALVYEHLVKPSNSFLMTCQTLPYELQHAVWDEAVEGNKESCFTCVWWLNQNVLVFFFRWCILKWSLLGSGLCSICPENTILF